jgi:hypothetical protein
MHRSWHDRSTPDTLLPCCEPPAESRHLASPAAFRVSQRYSKILMGPQVPPSAIFSSGFPGLAHRIAVNPQLLVRQALSLALYPEALGHLARFL